MINYMLNLSFKYILCIQYCYEIVPSFIGWLLNFGGFHDFQYVGYIYAQISQFSKTLPRSNSANIEDLSKLNGAKLC